MYFYILEKNGSYSAIEADEKLFLAFEKQGFHYIDKVAAKDKASALNLVAKPHVTYRFITSLLTLVSFLFITILYLNL